MIELARLSREELTPWLAKLADELRADPRIVGVALGYDEAFVTIVSRLPTEHPDGSVEHSAVVASRLADAQDVLTTRASRSTPEANWDVTRAIDEWGVLSQRRYNAFMSPIRIEVTFEISKTTEDRSGAAQATEAREDSPSRYPTSVRDMPVHFRPARRARLHLARAGGRARLLVRQVGPAPAGARAWGTLGGFLCDAHGELFAVTAGHVVGATGDMIATPAFPTSMGLARRALQAASLWSAAFAERGVRRQSSQPDVVATGQCQARTNPATSGLDFALFAWPNHQARALEATPVVELGEISQVLKARFVGARSGLTKVRVTRYSVWHAYDLDEKGTQVACVSDCLEVALDPRPYVRTDVSRGGDSGSWLVCDSAEGPRWLGLLVGGDGDRTGIVPAYRIRDELLKSVGEIVPMI